MLSDTRPCRQAPFPIPREPVGDAANHRFVGEDLYRLSTARLRRRSEPGAEKHAGAREHQNKEGTRHNGPPPVLNTCGAGIRALTIEENSRLRAARPRRHCFITKRVTLMGKVAGKKVLVTGGAPTNGIGCPPRREAVL